MNNNDDATMDDNMYQTASDLTNSLTDASHNSILYSIFEMSVSGSASGPSASAGSSIPIHDFGGRGGRGISSNIVGRVGTRRKQPGASSSTFNSPAGRGRGVSRNSGGRGGSRGRGSGTFSPERGTSSSTYNSPAGRGRGVSNNSGGRVGSRGGGRGRSTGTPAD